MLHDAGVVDQDVHRPQLPFHGFHQAIDFRGPGDVGAHGHGAAVQSPDKSAHFQGLLLLSMVVYGHVHTCCRQGQGHRPADAPGGPGDQGHFAFQVSQHRRFLF